MGTTGVGKGTGVCFFPFCSHDTKYRGTFYLYMCLVGREPVLHGCSNRGNTALHQ